MSVKKSLVSAAKEEELPTSLPHLRPQQVVNPLPLLQHVFTVLD